MSTVGAPSRLPRIGFGVYRSPPSLCKSSCLAALASGYRHIDTAQLYGNEAEVGAAVRNSGIPREETFVTTKLWAPSGTIEATLERCRQSVAVMGLDCVDLFLVHSPRSGKEGRREMWSALERLAGEGKTRAVGVSNYGVKHLEEMKEYSGLAPAVNQIELHPFYQQRNIVEYCMAHGIIVEAYSPLVRGRQFQDPTLCEIAGEHGVTPAQVLVRWSLQKGYIPLPKSDRPERIRENRAVDGFVLTEEQMMRLDALDRRRKGATIPQRTECE